MHAGLGRPVVDHDEVPGLHQSDGWGMMGGPEDLHENVFRDRVGAKGTDVASRLDHVVESRSFVRRERMAHVTGTSSTLIEGCPRGPARIQ